MEVLLAIWMLIFSFGILAVFGSVIYFVLKITKKNLGNWAAGTVAAFFIIFAAYNIFSINRDCAAEPTFVPPSCDDVSKCGEGSVRFACDGPGGIFIYFSAEVLLPALMLLTMALGYRTLVRPSSNKSEA